MRSWLLLRVTRLVAAVDPLAAHATAHGVGGQTDGARTMKRVAHCRGTLTRTSPARADCALGRFRSRSSGHRPGRPRELAVECSPKGGTMGRDRALSVGLGGHGCVAGTRSRLLMALG